MERLLDYRECAELLHIKPSTVRLWVFQKRLPVVRIGRAVRFRPSDLEAFVQEGFEPRKE